MAEHTPSVMRGLLVPDSRITFANIDTTDSTYTEASPRAGVPEAQDDTEMVLAASGSQSAGGALRIQAQSAGFPTRDGATFLWKSSADASTGWRGWNAPNAVAAVEPLHVPTVATEEYKYPHAVTLSSGAILAVTCQNTTGTNTLDLHKRNAAGTWSDVEIATVSDQSTSEAFPCLVVLPSGRVLCFAVVYDTSNSLGQVRAWVSDDDGATWSVYAAHTLRTELDTSTDTVHRMRADFDPATGGILLVLEVDIGAAKNALVQYASDDFGATFSQVLEMTGAATNASTNGRNHDVSRLPGGGFLVLYQHDPASTQGQVFGIRLSTAWQSIASTTQSYVAGIGDLAAPANHAVIECALCTLGDALYAYTVGHPDSGSDSPVGQSAVSFDGGETWTRIGQNVGGSSDAKWFNASGGSAYPVEITATAQRGRVVLLSNHSANGGSGADADSLWAWYLGGYSTVELPSIDLIRLVENQMSWTATWASLETPSDGGWTATGTAATESTPPTSAGWNFTTSSAAYMVSKAPGLAPSTGAIGAAVFKVDGGQGELRITASDGSSEDYRASIRLSTTTADVYDYNATATVGSTTAISSGAWVAVLLGVADGKVFAAIRTAPTNEDAEWTVLANGTSLTAGGGAGVADEVAFGDASALSSSDITARFLGYAIATEFSANLASGQTNPDDLRGRPFSPLPVYVDDGVRVAAVDGPASRGDTWHINAGSDYSIRHMHPDAFPSPQTEARASETTGPVRVAWTLGADDGGYLEADSWGMVLTGLNVPIIGLEYEDQPANGWTAIDTSIDLRTSLVFQRSGTSVRPSTAGSNAAGPYVRPGELVGCSFEFPNGDVRRIAWNSGGYLTSGSTIDQKRAIIRLDATDADDGEDQQGTGYIWPRNATIILHRMTSGQILSGLRLSLDPAGSYTPAHGYVQIPKVLAGPLVVFGLEYSQTRRRRLAPNVALSTNRAGMTRARVLGPAVMEMDVSWTESVDTRYVNGTAGGDDYLTATATSGAHPIANRRDAPMVLHGLVDALDGPATVLGFLPYIGRGTPDVVAHTLGERCGHMVRIVGELSLETQDGDEGEDELIRPSMTLRWEV